MFLGGRRCGALVAEPVGPDLGTAGLRASVMADLALVVRRLLHAVGVLTVDGASGGKKAWGRLGLASCSVHPSVAPL